MLVALACDGCIGNVLHQAATDGHARLQREVYREGSFLGRVQQGL
jgi:hypothetical protein